MNQRVADRLEAARHELFVGRAVEKALFLGALGDDSPRCVIHVHGLGGIGKTTFLRECVALCRQRDMVAVRLDARHLDASPASFLGALAAGLEVPPAAGNQFASLDAISQHIALQPGRCVIFVDTCELLTPLEGWLREELLPGLPENVLVVLAGRTPPGAAWSSDAGWSRLWLSVPLHNLDNAESHDYLSRRQVPAAQHQAILEFTHGHPLALSLVADLYAQNHFDAAREFSFAPDAVPEVANILLRHLVQHEPDSLHLAALQSCALVRLTTEDLLAALLDVPDAHAPFERLRSLSFVETGRSGLFPHDLVREVLLADLKWRNPSLNRQLHCRAREFYAARLQVGDAGEQQRTLFDYVFLHRNNPVVRPFLDWRESGTLQPGPARPGEMAALTAIVERHEGRESAQLAAHWFARQPQGVLALRDAAGLVAGFLGMVSLARAAESDIEADPATSAARRHLNSSTPLRPGEDATVFRFWMCAENYQGISPAQSLIFIHIVHHYLVTPGLAFTFFPCSDPELWAPIFGYAGARRLAGADFSVGGKNFGVYGHDWRALPPLSWLELLAERELTLTPPAETATPPAVEVLTREQFSQAVRHALRDLSRPHALRDNPLLRSRLVVGRAGSHAGPDARVAALQALLFESCKSLLTSPRESKHYRALHHAYLHPAATQEQAAELLDLPFSTFRRHLKSGINAVNDSLWSAEFGH